MRLATLGTLLRIAGLAIGVAAIAALVLGVDLSRLSPFLVKVAIYKLVILTALAMLAAGAMLGRKARAGGASERTPR